MELEDLLFHFYPEDTPLRRLLLLHSTQVRNKALAILAGAPSGVRNRIDEKVVSAGAMLHDVGICACDAPSILCCGKEPYLRHGIIGGEMLRSYGAENGLDLEKYARISERHTGTGLTREEILAGDLPIPPKDLVPETWEEKLVCLADKFYSKSGDRLEKSFDKVRSSIARHGDIPAQRFDELCSLFNYTGKVIL